MARELRRRRAAGCFDACHPAVCSRATARPRECSARCCSASCSSSSSRSSCCGGTATRTIAKCTTAPCSRCSIGDAFHNFVDGAVVAAAVLTSVPLGISTALAVAAHEIPQEVGDFAILLHAGYSRRRALLLNVLSAAASGLGAIAACVSFDLVPRLLPYFLALAAASFLYVAMADLIPGLHGDVPTPGRCARFS